MTLNYNKVTELVLAAKELVLNSKQAEQITVKGLADYVTQVDISVQNFLVGSLSQLDPDIQFLCEEGAHKRLDWERPIWILDPVDGTTNLIHDYHVSAVSLGLWNGTEMEYGCVFNPFWDELYHAIRGQGAFLNGKAIHVSKTQAMVNSVVAVGTAPWDKTRVDQVFGTIKKIFLSCQDVRRTGSAALDCCSVACGRVDGFFEYDLKPWDYAAGSLIVEEAGGSFTNLKGQRFRPDHTADLIATNGRIHPELIACLEQDA